MNVLVIGKGGREHALIWKLSQSPLIKKIIAAPGNDGMKDLATLAPVSEDDFKALVDLAREHCVDLTVVGPEIPLSNGIVDYFEARSLKIFGPTAAASRLESSKIFAKTLMKKYGIPTADFFIAQSRKDAVEYLNRIADGPLVVKADGLAAGKGVYICQNRSEALQAVEEMMGQDIFGEAGSRIVFEEMMVGEEASVFALTDGKKYVVLPPAQDHKRVFNGDKGKNTGGMGAYAPAPVVDKGMLARIEKEIIKPTINAMSAEGNPFKGCLYAGLMLTENGPRVVEFNCRFGDPETQVVIPLVKSDLLPVFKGIAQGNLKNDNIDVSDESAICVVLASGGYPGSYEKNKKIIGLEKVPASGTDLIFHAGTRIRDGHFYTDGGRVLNIVNINTSLQAAYDGVYFTLKHISFEKMHFRHDIAHRALKKVE